MPVRPQKITKTAEKYFLETKNARIFHETRAISLTLPPGHIPHQPRAIWSPPGTVPKLEAEVLWFLWIFNDFLVVGASDGAVLL